MPEPDFDQISAIVQHRPDPAYPWAFASEDRWAAQEAVKILYASLQIAQPRFAWAPSPAAMHRASRMLRQVQAGTAYQMVQALVPVGDGDRIDREAKIALLAAMIDPDVTTQSGGLIINLISGVFGGPASGMFPALTDLRNQLKFAESDPSRTTAPATFMGQSLWPAFYPGFNVFRLSPIQRQAIIIMPFTRICWLCRPPLYIRTDENGRLHCADGPAAEWSDGFKVWCDRTPPEEREKLRSGEVLALPEATEDLQG
jgi:hypothetical protein